MDLEKLGASLDTAPDACVLHEKVWTVIQPLGKVLQAARKQRKKYHWCQILATRLCFQTENDQRISLNLLFVDISDFFRNAVEWQLRRNIIEIIFRIYVGMLKLVLQDSYTCMAKKKKKENIKEQRVILQPLCLIVQYRCSYDLLSMSLSTYRTYHILSAFRSEFSQKYLFLVLT